MPQITLTSTELEILQAIARGESAKQIAAVTGCSKRTVESHSYRMRRKIGAHNMAELVYRAIGHGLLPLPNASPSSLDG
jgi:DNA-binding NarL/FixJ family response regulator